eukprot:CAMPEP_0182591864 /NCGR_PEP_ID=MMETSP1324-20130603/74725_1 /TAXON_ID=236786 /ORGANISM="Florenciella sp., Strain RCC1587" /LENGTH=400 /DNA_ID=CAMNT_0024809211 /DNA_START=51 /DNA_END=1250 /DNA_ORIENTATION=+
MSSVRKKAARGSKRGHSTTSERSNPPGQLRRAVLRRAGLGQNDTKSSSSSSAAPSAQAKKLRSAMKLPFETEEGYEYEPISNRLLEPGEEHPGFKRRRVGTKAWDYCCAEHGLHKSRCRECLEAEEQRGFGVQRRELQGGAFRGASPSGPSARIRPNECKGKGKERQANGSSPDPSSKPNGSALSAGNCSITKTNARVGMAVEARYDKGQTVKFYPGTISRAYRNGTFEITFSDGDVEKGVRPEWVRLPLSHVKESLAGELAKLGDSPEMISAQLCNQSSNPITEKRPEKKRELLNIGSEHLNAQDYQEQKGASSGGCPGSESGKKGKEPARSDSPRGPMELAKLSDSSELQGAGPRESKRARSAPEVLNIVSVEGKDYAVTTPKKSSTNTGSTGGGKPE